MFRRWNNRELNCEDRFFRKAVFFILFADKEKCLTVEALSVILSIVGRKTALFLS